MSSKPFQFKQFTIHQDRCAMKVGTDGVLLGAWTKAENSPKRILDIGTGTGLIGLMMAQKYPDALIDAVEINKDAYEQASENFSNSTWSNRLNCIHTSLQKSCKSTTEKFDLIISNPPFFTDGYKSQDDKRNLARSTDSLSYSSLLSGISNLLSEEGTCSLVIPYDQQESLLNIAKSVNLYSSRITHVKGRLNTPIKRSLIELKFEKVDSIKITELIIEKERHQYTDEYINLTKDFYLKM